MDYAKDACQLLDADHIAVKHLFVEFARITFASASSADATKRHTIAMKICAELTVHAQIEEEIFYPALREALPADGDLLDEAEEEHAHAKDLITRIRALDVADGGLETLVVELNRVIEHHVKEERDEIFPKAKTAPGIDLEAMGEQLRDRQQALQGELVSAK
jgi:hypothetical protein